MKKPILLWDSDTSSCPYTPSSDFSWHSSTIINLEPNPELIEDGPWRPLYDYGDYVGIAHQILAEHLGYADLRVST